MFLFLRLLVYAADVILPDEIKLKNLIFRLTISSRYILSLRDIASLINSSIARIVVAYSTLGITNIYFSIVFAVLYFFDDGW